MEQQTTYTAFIGPAVIASGSLEAMLPILKTKFDQDAGSPFVILEDQSGRQIDFDLRGDITEVVARALPAPARSGPGRPKLGVISREVSLLPRHWNWLEGQPNGASAALRRLVDEARKQNPGEQRARYARDAAGRIMSAIAGDLPNYEEANRALYAGNRERFEDVILDWPHDIRTYIQRRAEDSWAPSVN